MGKLYDALDERWKEFIANQKMFFVATAPSGSEGHINCSPKGHDTFRVLDGNTVGYLDYTASGVETIAHIRDNGRVVVMFCAFEGPPKILRLYGTGRVVEAGDAEFEELLPTFNPPRLLGVRSIILVSLTRIADSCGYTIPLYEYKGERDQLMQWADRKGPAGVAAYQKEKNAVSIDGLPGLPSLDE